MDELRGEAVPVTADSEAHEMDSVYCQELCQDATRLDALPSPGATTLIEGRRIRRLLGAVAAKISPDAHPIERARHRGHPLLEA